MTAIVMGDVNAVYTLECAHRLVTSTLYAPRTARSCGADLEDHQSVFRTLWLVRRSRSLAILTEFRTPVCLEIVLSVATSAWLLNVAELSPLTLRSFHCLLRPAEARPLRWCDVKNVDGSLSTRYEKVSGIVSIREPKTCKMADHCSSATRAFGMTSNLSTGQCHEILNA